MPSRAICHQRLTCHPASVGLPSSTSRLPWSSFAASTERARIGACRQVSRSVGDPIPDAGDVVALRHDDVGGRPQDALGGGHGLEPADFSLPHHPRGLLGGPDRTFGPHRHGGKAPGSCHEDVTTLDEVHHLDEERPGVARGPLEDGPEGSPRADPEFVGVDRQDPVGALHGGQARHPRDPLRLVHGSDFTRQLDGQVRREVCQQLEGPVRGPVVDHDRLVDRTRRSDGEGSSRSGPPRCARGTGPRPSRSECTAPLRRHLLARPTRLARAACPPALSMHHRRPGASSRSRRSSAS